MIKGICQKAETLNDGSVKLSIYFNKEDIQFVFPLAYKEVSVKEFEATDVNKDTAIHLACEAIKRIEDMLIGELINSVKLDNNSREEDKS